MSVKDSTLKILEENRNSYISGEKLASRLGVSRNAVWKSIESLRGDGYIIDAVQNKGYALKSDCDPITLQGMEKQLGDGEFSLLIYPELDSTNNKAKELAQEGCDEWTVVMADRQTGGKGRLGRSFFSPMQSGIYMSAVLRPVFPAAEALNITVAAAVAAARAIEEVSGKKADIKWVNDIYINEKKVCGILTEAGIDIESGGLNYAVVGIGINVAPPSGGFPEDICRIASAVFEETRPGARSRIAALTLKFFKEYYLKLGDKDYFEDYLNRLFIIGREVTVIRGNTQKRARVTGLNRDFSLRVEYLDGSEDNLRSGEISLKI